MTLTDQHIISLVLGSLRDELTPEQQLELSEWLAVSDKRQIWFRQLEEADAFGQALALKSPEAAKVVEAAIYDKIIRKAGIGQPDKQQSNPIIHRVHLLKTAWFRYAAAILIFIGSGSVIYLWNTQQKEKAKTARIEPVPGEKNEVLPGGNKAMLTLADGRQIVLDSTANGSLAIENGSVVTKQQGGIIYDAGKVNSISPTYNTMTTPRGGQYQLTLADGTKVWLNAASAITYPTAFKSAKREVTLSGEAYFEVTRNASQPFVVRAGGEEIEVLGTAFNVNSYEDEIFKASLINGKIKIDQQVLTPGQAYIRNKVVETSIEQDVAWKNGSFSFSNRSLEQVIREFGRWYDVEPVYVKGVPDIKLAGSMGRDVALSKVLVFLRGNQLHCRLEGKKLIIEP